MKKFKIYDLKLRKNYKKKEFDQLFWRLLSKNKNVSYLFLGLFLRNERKKKAYLTKTKNVCIVTGRTRSIYKAFKISRIILRELGSQGLIFGLKKASW